MTLRSSPSTADLRVVQQGTGPDVLLIAGTSDPAEAWQAQLDGLADRWTVTAFDNRGAGRSPLPPDGRLTIAGMADDAVAVLDRAGIERAHVCGFSQGGTIAQELALRHPDRVRSLVLNGTFAWLDPLLERTIRGWRWLAEAAPSDRAFLELFLTWIYTPQFHASGAVDAIIDEVLSDPHAQPADAFQAQLDALFDHDTRDRLGAISVPTLVISGALDLVCPPRTGDELAHRIPGAVHRVVAEYAHQPFQEDPEGWNALVDAFWRAT